MLTDAASNTTGVSRSQHRESGTWLSRKIWLPKLIYNALPLFYVLAGVAAFLATVYISAWFWILPHYVLFSAACVHLGILVYRRRHRTDS